MYYFGNPGPLTSVLSDLKSSNPNYVNHNPECLENENHSCSSNRDFEATECNGDLNL